MKELNPSKWVAQLDLAANFRRDYGWDMYWSKSEEYFYGIHENSPKLGPNIIFSTGDTLLSTLSVPNPRVLIKATSIESVGKTQILEQVDNALVNGLNMPTMLESVCLAAYLYGVGFAKIGYDSEFGFDPNPAGFTLTQFDSKGKRIEFYSTKPGQPWIMPVVPQDILVPWGTSPNLDSARWVAHRVCRHIDELRADSKYENISKISPNTSLESFLKSYKTINRIWKSSPGGFRSGMDFVEFYEIHDRATGRIYCVVPNSSNQIFIRNEPDTTQINGLPFVSVSFIPRTTSLWGISDVVRLMPHQEELSDIANQAAIQRRIAAIKIGVLSQYIDEGEIEKLNSPTPGTVVKFNESTNDIHQAIVPLQLGNNLSLYNDAQYVRRDSQEQVGMSSNQFANYDSSSRRSATEAAIVDRRADMRMNRRTKQIADFYAQAFEKINSLLFEYWTVPLVLQTVGQDGLPQWISVAGNQLKGSYAYSVEFSAEGMMTLEARRQMAINAYLMLRQDPSVDPANLRTYLANAFNDPDFTAVFRPPQSQRDIQDANLLLQMSGVSNGVRTPPSPVTSQQVSTL